MKNKFFTLAITTVMAGTILVSCQTTDKKVEIAQENVQDAKNNVVAANEALNQAILDSIRQFRETSKELITANDKKIADFRAHIAKEKKENRDRYEEKIAGLERQNRNMKSKLDDFREDSKTKWENFRAEFKHDMDEFGHAFKDLTVKNK